MPKKSNKKPLKPLQVRVVQLLREQRASPIQVQVLAKRAQVAENEQAEFKNLIDTMVQEGELFPRKSTVVLCKNKGIAKARVTAVMQNFGFVHPTALNKKGEPKPDIFIPGRFLLGAVPGDVVLVKQSKNKLANGKGPEGAIVKVLTQANWEFCGVVQARNHRLFVIPDKNVRVPLEVESGSLNGAKAGDKVRAAITTRGQEYFEHRVKILNVFGSSELALSCCEAILETYNARTDFSLEVLAEVDTIATRAVTEEELQGRLDLTNLNIFTIDSADSKDLDDAVSLEEKDDKWILGVHIADVSHYVSMGSAVDKEAYARGTSVYYADQVIPMLPKALSNGICSLNPGEIRLTFSAFITLDKSGKMLSYKFTKSYICSRVKGIYKEINSILENKASAAVKEKYKILIPEIFKMQELAGILSSQRFGRGAMDIQSTESKIIIENGRVTDIKARESGISERIIEEFMLTANEAAASLAMENDLPFIYRIHDKPPEMKLDTLHKMLSMLGIDGRKIGTNPEPKDLADILEKVRGTELETMVNTQLLRTMSKAIYSEENIGHFGLVLKNYAHFTSPIRRYPDLTIHRILSAYVEGVGRDKIMKKFAGYVAQAAKNSSSMELNSMNIERDCEDCYKAEYMSHHIGEEFDVVVSSAMAFGLYVQMPNTVEGLVHVRNMPSGEYTLSDGMELIERRSGARYRIGQKLRVKVVSVDVSAGQVDFVLADSQVQK